MKATVSGSFHRYMLAIYDAVGELRARGVDVLSPSDPRVVDNIGEFLFVASDRLRSIKLVQDRHFAAIRASDFLWVVTDGYIGNSTSGEIAFAVACGVPVFAVGLIEDSTFERYVTRVSSFDEAIERVQELRRRPRGANHLLIDPEEALDRAHEDLEVARPFLLGRRGDLRRDAESAYAKLRQALSDPFGFKN